MAIKRLSLGAVRDADWLTARRAQAWCFILAVMTSIVAIGWIGVSHHGLDKLGKPIGTDFLSFWTASRLALDGQPASAYDPAIHGALQQSLFPETQLNYYAFFYPPPFLLLCLPLALLPYLWALISWLAVGFVLFFFCLRRLLPRRWAILPIVAAPGVFQNIGHGQNGFVTGFSLGGGMLFAARRPFLSGLCLGLMVVKPHLALGMPVMLLAARRWRVLFGALVSALGLCALSWLVLGSDAWVGFLTASSLARGTMEQGLVDPGKMQSVFAAIRLWRGGIDLAYIIQIAVALTICALLARIAARRPGAHPEWALAIAASLLCTPFLLPYDLVLLALPIAWVVGEAQNTGWCPWEKIVLFTAYLLPLISPTTVKLDIPIAPVVLAAVFWIVAKRAASRPI